MMTEVGEEISTELELGADTDDSAKIDLSNAAEGLASGLLTIYKPPLERIRTELRELTNKQESLLSQMQAENRKLSETLEDIELSEMFATVKLYQGKLATIKKEMISIHERTTKLKKRALRLQQIKQKEALQREQQREMELRREQDLIGKPLS